MPKFTFLQVATLLYVACLSFFTSEVKASASIPKGESQSGIKVYTLDVTKGEHRKVSYWLKAGGVDPNGDSLNVNSLYWTRKGKPWLPVMGEFHYARFPKSGWEEQLLKMKAAGISIVSTYVFWVNTENPKGVWDWNGDNDLRYFLQLCQKHKLYVWLRPGPYINAEAKNGGFPDWVNKPGRRTNASWYLDLVRDYYRRVGEQTQGLFYKDGGPIIGLQVDNEYAHGDSTHLGVLLTIAKEAGMVAPFNTITNNSKHEYSKGDLIPLQGAYPYRGWTGPTPTTDYLYSSDDWNAMQNIGGLPYDGTLFPRGMAELGVACWQGYNQRFIVPAYDSEGHLQNCLGRGINLVGYYMFQGGTQKSGFEGDGHPLTYDFQAPLGEYGQVRPSYHSLKLIHSFLNDFGAELAMMQPARPNPMVLDPTNSTDLRYIGRFNGQRGFLFMTNVQNWVPRVPINNFQVKISFKDGTILFPRTPITLKPNTAPIFPINFNLNGVNLKYATAQLLSKVEEGGIPYYFFFEVDGIKSEFAVENGLVEQNGKRIAASNGIAYVSPLAGMGKAFTVTAKDGAKSVVVLLTRKQAEQSWRFNIDGKERLLISNANLLVDGEELELSTKNKVAELYSFPSIAAKALKEEGKRGIFTKHTFTFPGIATPVEIAQKGKEWVVNFSKMPEGVKDYFLNVSYVGSVGEVYLDGKKYSDDRYNGTVWDLGIKRFVDGKQHYLTFRALPWDDNVKGVAPKDLPKSSNERAGAIRTITAQPEYVIRTR